jgi:outer membrane protein assembly factor BamB
MLIGRLRRRPPPALAALAGLLLLAAGCGGITNPRGWASPEIDGGVMFVSLDPGQLSALNAETLSEKWTFGSEDEFACGGGEPQARDLEGIYAPPAVGDDLLFIGAYDNNLYAVGREEGDCRWLFETGDPIVGGPVLGDAGLYVPSSDGYLYVVDPTTGQSTQSFSAGNIWSTPLLTDDALFVSTMDGTLWKLDPGTLDNLWAAPFEVNAGLLTDPVLADDHSVVVGGIGRELYAIDTESGERKWSVGGRNWFWGRPLVEGGRVFATTLAGQVFGIDANTGDEAWSFTTENPVRAGAVLSGGLVIVVDERGDVYGFDPETGAKQWGPTSLDRTVRATPLVQGDSVFIVSDGGDLYTIDAETGRAEPATDSDAAPETPEASP